MRQDLMGWRERWGISKQGRGVGCLGLTALGLALCREPGGVLTTDSEPGGTR